jgi:hypothetical protein
MNKEFIGYLHRRTARASVGASTARGMGPEGTITAAREFLAAFDLRKFRVRSERKFQQQLNLATEALRMSLPPDAQHWGSARKFFNIYIRGALYNKYLCEHFELAGLEAWLEVPLDSHVAKGLRTELEGATLPGWKTVISLTPELNAEFQAVASNVSDRLGVARVHLDAKYWRGDHIAKH